MLSLKGTFWAGVIALNNQFGAIGYLIIALFAAGWLVSIAVYRIKGYDELTVETGAIPRVGL
jgi:high-affinity nickel-transport protein